MTCIIFTTKYVFYMAFLIEISAIMHTIDKFGFSQNGQIVSIKNLILKIDLCASMFDLTKVIDMLDHVLNCHVC